MDIRPIDANALYEEAFGKLRKGEVLYSFSPSDIDNAPTLSLNTLRDAIYEDAVEHGLWEEGTGSHDDMYRAAVKIKAEVDELIAESVIAMRHSTHCMDISDGAKKKLEDAFFKAHNNAIEELADVVIMCFSVAGKLGIDIDAAIRRKMEINKGRPWKHGKSNE